MRLAIARAAVVCCVVLGAALVGRAAVAAICTEQETDFQKLVKLARSRLDAEKPLATQPSSIRVSVDSRMELLSVIFRLAGSDEFGSNGFSRYAGEVDARFGPFAQHPAVLFARRMRQEVGISADGVVVLAAHLAPLPSLEGPSSFKATAVESRWRAGDAEEFAELARNFARDSNFGEFVSQSRPIYELASLRMQKLVQEEIEAEWFDAYFGERPDSQLRVAVGLLNGSISYGFTSRRPGHPDDLWAVMGTWLFDQEGLPIYDQSVAPTLVHEFCHSYVDPAVAKRAAEFEAAGKALQPALGAHLPRMRQYYWRTLFEESLVRAVVARYLLAHEGPEAARKQLRREASNGFVWTELLYALLEEYEQDRRQYEDFEHFLPRTLDFFTKLPQQLPEMVKAVER